MKPGQLCLVRQLLAFLTVLASLVFQLRMDALGSLNIGRPGTSVQALTGAAQHPSHGETQHVPFSGQTPGHSAAHPAGHHMPPPSERPTPADPHDGHGAHCPFCLTNAFALEADLAGWPQGPPDFLPQPRTSAGFRVVTDMHHADARAPPAGS